MMQLLPAVCKNGRVGELRSSHKCHHQRKMIMKTLASFLPVKGNCPGKRVLLIWMASRREERGEVKLARLLSASLACLVCQKRWVQDGYNCTQDQK